MRTHKEKMNAKKPSVYVLPCAIQSHINPMLHFSKCLASNTNLNVTFFIPTNSKKSTLNLPPNTSITYQFIPNGFEETQEPLDNQDNTQRFKDAVSKHMTEFLIEQRKSSHFCPKIIVYDSILPWVLDIAHQLSLLGASFFMQSCSVSTIYFHIKQGLLRFPFEDQLEVELPFLPKLGASDLSAIDNITGSSHTIIQLLADQFLNLEKADFVLFNSFDELEIEIVRWMMTRWAIKTIGPTHLLLQNDVFTPHKNNNTINLFEPDQEACTKWLDLRETGSVIYVSFGSLISLEKEQIEEVAYGLMMSKCWFLWVVRATEEHKLPPNFTSLASERGLIVNWCTQTEVLAHRALSCFLTHGGWNSTIEGLSYGLPLVVLAHWVDQTTNAKFIEDVWSVGVRIRVRENGMISREDVCKCVVEVAQGDKGKELKRNASKMKKLADEAVGEGGTTSKNIEDIVSRILC